MSRYTSILLALLLGLSTADKLDDVLTLSNTIFPATDSPKCPGAASTTFSSVFTSTDYISDWKDYQLQWEDDAFAVEMNHADASSDAKSWSLRLGQGGQIMSFIVNTGESIANQASASAIWNDLVQQMVAVDGSKNYAQVNGTAYANFIHGSGVYAYASEGTNNPPFYNPKLASQCGGNDCTMIHWGQQAHVPTPWSSPLLYYTRYRNCGNGIIQYDMAMYHFGTTTQTFSYFNTPWTGVRTSTFPHIMLSDAASGTLYDTYPLNGFGSDGNQLRNLDTMGGFTTFAEQVAIPQYQTPFCVDSLNPSNWYYCDDGNAPATLERFRFEVKVANSVQATGHWSSYGLAAGSTVRMQWCQLTSAMTQGDPGWGSPGRSVIITNDNTGDAFESDSIIHYCWSNNYSYMSANETSSWINSKFPLGSVISVAYKDTSGLPPDQQGALTFVHGQNDEYNDPNNYYYGKSRLRFGATNANRDGTVFTTNFLGYLRNEQVYYARKFMVTDLLSNMETTGNDLKTEAYEEVFDAGAGGAGESITLYSDATTSGTFGAGIGVEVCSEATAVCSGNSSPSSVHPRPLFYIQCGSNTVVTHDPYTDPYSGSVPLSNEIKRPYQCQLDEFDVTKTGRATWKLLGFFADDACASLTTTTATYVSDYCEQRTPSASPSVVSSDSPSRVASSVPTVTASDTPSVTASDTPSITASSSPSKMASSTPTITASDTPTITSSISPSKMASSTPTITASIVPTITSSSSPSQTALCGTNPATGGTPNNNGICEAGEDCTNSSNDCDGQLGGNPQQRFCCHGGPSSSVAYGTLCTDSRCSSGECNLSNNNDEPVAWCCGDGVCAGGGETTANCPQDCNSTPVTTPAPTLSAPVTPAPTTVTPPTTGGCYGRNAFCNHNSECCSGNCKNNGKCA